MGILNGGTGRISATSITGLLGIGGSVSVESPPGPDFPKGLRIVEIVDGKERTADQVVLVGSFMPHIPFEFGGNQQIVKEYYAGSSEPTVQVLGPREKDVTIRGRLKTKFLKQESLQAAAVEYQELIDAMRIRGNLVRIELGEWFRYGFLEECTFKLNRLVDIEYDIRFTIVGFNIPSNCKFTDQGVDDLIKPNKDVTTAAAAALAERSNIPAEMPQSLSNLLDSAISNVAEVVGTVTNFVDSIIADVKQLQASANRALGLIRYARSYIARTTREIGQIALNVTALGDSFASEAEKTVATIKSVDSIYRIRATNFNLALFLAALQRKFEGLARTVPLRRHLVRQGDNLQRLAVQYYGHADSWRRIYEHNGLRSTDLVVGTVIEIPRL